MNNNRTPNTRVQNNSGEIRKTAAEVNSRQNSKPSGRMGVSQNTRSPQRPIQNGTVSHGRPTNASNASQKGTNNSGISRISAQTPNNRRAQRNRVSVSKEQIEIRSANKQKGKFYVRKGPSLSWRTLLTRAILFVVVFALLFALCGGLFYMNLTSSEKESASRYSYVIGDKKYSLSYDKAVRDGRVYVNFNDIAELFDLSVTGTADDMKFIVNGDDTETIRFIGGSRSVYVNGTEARLGSESYVSDGNIYVPLDFVNAYLKGVDIKLDSRSHKVTISKIVTNLDEKGKLPNGTEPVYDNLNFLLKSPLGLKPLDEKAEALAPAPDLGFLTNLEIYEEYMNPGNTDEYLFIVSREHMLGADYVPQDFCELADTRKDGRAPQLMRRNAAMSLEAMFKEMRAAGFTDVSVTSAYRNYSYQETLYNSYVKQYGEEYAKTISMPAGASEHQSGLCADLHNLPGADKVFANEPVYEWLKNNCWKFGFILRYPEDKTEITFIDFEPWHYRYVGRYHAQKIYEMGMCLEEYMDYISVE